MRRPLYFEIFAASLAAILLEIAYTRVFSFKVYYYFTYLIIGIALLGLGAGAVFLTLFPRLRDRPPERVVAGASLAGGATVLAGYLVTARVQLNASALSLELTEVVKLLVVAAVVTLPFIAVGIVVSTILSARVKEVGRLYAADLVGAGLGCALSIPLLRLLDPPRVIVLAGAVLGAAGLRGSAGSPVLRGATVLVVFSHLVPMLSGSILPDPIVDRLKGYENFRDAGLVRTTRWDPVFRVDVADHPKETGDLFLLFHDGSPGSGMRRMDAGKSAFSHLDENSRKLPFEILGPVEPRVLIIGSAGGHEIVASLHFGAKSVTGVELNATTLDLLTGEYAEITGNLGEDPRVTLVNGDGRWFLSQTDKEFDLIWFVAPDSYAAMNASTSGAYVLAESYLYTVETMRAALDHLSPGGALCAQFGEFDYGDKPNRTVRFLATARQAYYEKKIPDFDKRVVVSTALGLPPFSESTVVLTKQELTDTQVARFEASLEGTIPGGEVRYTPKRKVDHTPVNQVIEIPQDLIDEWYRDYPYLVTPVRDESPFFWHFARFSDVLVDATDESGGPIDFEDAIGERVTFVLLGIAIALGALFLLSPLLLARGTWRSIPHKGPTALYFSALGLGFMFIEVTLIQKLTLLLGYPTRSLTVTLLSLLVSSGAGSFLASRYRVPWDRALGRLIAALVILITVWLTVMPSLVDAFVGAALPVRILLCVATTAPIGVCLGSFLPVGLEAITNGVEHAREAVAWAWAVNAFASVVASIASALFAMAVGFKLLIIAAPVIYIAGAIALIQIAPLPGRTEPESS